MPKSDDQPESALVVQYREATEHDAGSIAALHADSWRRHYRGAYLDSYLDGDILPERQEVWTIRLSPPRLNHLTVCADLDGEMIGFAHTIFGHDPKWGALLDNLHVRSDLKGGGSAQACFRRQLRRSFAAGPQSLCTYGCSTRTSQPKPSMTPEAAIGCRPLCVVHFQGVRERLDTGTSGQILTDSSLEAPDRPRILPYTGTDLQRAALRTAGWVTKVGVAGPHRTGRAITYSRRSHRSTISHQIDGDV